VKILILTNLFPTPWDPRRGTFNRQQFQRLGQRHRVDVLTAVDFRERRGPRVATGVSGLGEDCFTFYHPPGIGRFLNALCFFACVMWQRGRALRAARYDVLLASWAFPDAVAGGWVARRLGIPYVVKVHGSDLNVQAASRLRRMQIGPALREADAVVAVSDALATRAVALGARADTVETLYNGVDTALFHPGDRDDARRRLGLPAHRRIVLFVGNLKAAKGCLDLLDAFAQVARIHDDACLVFVGDGAERHALPRRAASLGCASALCVIGAVDHAATADWFRAADLLCLPSHNEGVPNVVLEAMACGTPVVATRVGGIPEVLPALAGSLVAPHRPDTLAAALCDALARSFDTAAIAAHAARFRWDDNIDRLDRVLLNAVARHAAPSTERADRLPPPL